LPKWDEIGGDGLTEKTTTDDVIERGPLPATGRECAVVLNAGAGSLLGDDDARRALEEIFHRHGLLPTIQLCDEGTDIDAFVRAELQRGITTVIAGGGDGTVSTVASAIADSDAVLGVLPLGTLNHFAKDLGIPLDREAAVEVIAGGRIVTVDAAEVNGATFINNSSLGLYPLAVQLREEQQRRGSGKWVAFAQAAAKALGRYPLVRVHLSIDGAEVVRRTPILFIGNNHYELEGLAMGRRERIDRGVLSICVTREVTRLGLFALIARAIVGRLRESEDFSVFEGAELWVETGRRQLRVATDGEIQVFETPLRFRSRPGALRVLVPKEERQEEKKEEKA
jgi:diacylglycerol kinase family enzyme